MTDILALAKAVRDTGQDVEAARLAYRAASATAQKASDAVHEAELAYQQAQNALVVAAGGTDRNFQWESKFSLWEPAAAMGQK